MSIDKLREIVTGETQKQPEAVDVVGESYIKRTETWMESHKNLDRDAKIRQFESDLGARWQFTPNNKEYYWQTLEGMSSLSSDQFRDFTKRDIRSQLDGYKSTEAKENYFRDNAHTWPSYVTEDLEEYFFALKGLNDSKNIERNRINQTLEIQSLLNNKDLKLSPNVSLQSHVEDMLKAYDAGYGEEIDVDDSGRIAVPKDGMKTPVFSMDKERLPLEEEFISLNDLKPLVEKKFKTVLKRERKTLDESEKLAKTTLMNRAENGELPEQFVPNALIDGAALSSDPGSKIESTSMNYILNKVKSGAFGSSAEMMQYYYAMMEGINQTIRRRLTDGQG